MGELMGPARHRKEMGFYTAGRCVTGPVPGVAAAVSGNPTDMKVNIAFLLAGIGMSVFAILGTVGVWLKWEFVVESRNWRASANVFGNTVTEIGFTVSGVLVLMLGLFLILCAF